MRPAARQSTSSWRLEPSRPRRAAPYLQRRIAVGVLGHSGARHEADDGEGADRDVA